MNNNFTRLLHKILFPTPNATSPQSTVLYATSAPTASPSTAVNRIIFGQLLPSTTTTTTTTAPIYIDADSEPPESDLDTDNILLREERCWLSLSPATYEPTTAAVCSSLVVLGVIFILYGYRCFKTVMFFTGFIFASALVYLISQEHDLLPTYGNVAVAITAGALFGLTAMLVG